MRCTLDQCFVQIKKLIFLPFEVGASMRALIEVGKELAIFMYYKNRLCFTSDLDLKTPASRIFDISGFTEDVCHGVW